MKFFLVITILEMVFSKSAMWNTDQSCQTPIERKHYSICLFGSENNLLKLFKEIPTDEVLQNLTEAEVPARNSTDVMETKILQLKETLQSVEIENLRISGAFQDMNTSFQKDIKELTEADRLSNNVAAVMKTEMLKLKEASQKIGQSIASMEVKNRRISDAFQAMKDLFQKDIEKLNEADRLIKTAQEVTKTEIVELKKASQKNGQLIASVEAENRRMSEAFKEMELLLMQYKVLHDADIKRLTEADRLINSAQEVTKTEVVKLKEDLQSVEVENRRISDEFQEMKDLFQQDIDELSGTSKLQEVEITKLQEEIKLLKVDGKGKVQKNVSHSPALQQGNVTESKPVIFQWNVRGFRAEMQKMMRDDHHILESEQFFTIPNGLQFKPQLSIDDGSNIHIQLKFSSNVHDKGNPPTPFLHARKYILVDQSNKPENNSLELIDRPKFGTSSMKASHFSYRLFFPTSLLTVENVYEKNDQILILIILEPITFLYNQVASSDGVLLWKIDNYSKKKEDEADGVKPFLISKPFKTSAQGYQLQIQLYLNGAGRSDARFLSAFVHALVGDNDALLSPSFRCRLRFYILDQSDARAKANILTVKVAKFSHSESIYSIPRYMVRTRIENHKPKYLKDDALLINVAVQVL